MLTCKKCGAQFEWGVSKCPECNKPIIMEVDLDADLEIENDESEPRLKSCETCGRQINPQTGQCQVCAQQKKLYVDLEDESIQLKPFRRRKLKAVLLTAAILFFLVGGLGLFQSLTNPEPEIIAIENPSFRPTDPASIITDPQTGAEMVAGELVIIAREGSSAEDINGIAASVGGQVIGSMVDLNIYQVEIPGQDVNAILLAVSLLEQEEVIELVTANHVPQLLDGARRTPKDPQWTAWSIDRRWGQDYINLPQAWALTTGSPQVKIGIFEMGYDLEHTDLSHMKVVMGSPKLWKKKLSKYGAPVFDHGNNVAGIIGARSNNKKGMAGVLWEADYYCYIINSITDFVDCIENASSKEIKVINLSLIFGGNWANRGEADINDAKHIKESAIVLKLVNKYKHILFVQAAGNNPKVKVENMALASLGLDHDNVLTVGGIKEGGDIYSRDGYGSTYGHAVSIAAPAQDIWSATNRDFRSIYFPPLFDSSYGVSSGTSLATPFVTGVAGLILSVAPDLSPGEVKRIIMETAKPHVFDGNQFPLGAGVVDAYAAVLRARGEVPPDEEDMPEEEIPEEENKDDSKPEETGLNEAKRKEIINFMEEATSNWVASIAFPVFNDPNEISDVDLIFILLFSGMTPSYRDDYVLGFKGTDVQQTARLIFGSGFKEIKHRSIDGEVWEWEDSLQEYHIYGFGVANFTETHVIGIKEEQSNYVVDVVHLFYCYDCYDETDETEVYDESNNLITVLKGNEKISDAKLKNLPIRRYILKKTNDGGFYITQSIRM